MSKTLTQVMIIIHHRKVQELNFRLESKLNKIMCSPISLPSILFAIETMIATEIVLQSAGAGRRRRLEYRNPDGEMFINDTPLPLGALPGGMHRCQTHVHGWELPLSWDPLSRGRGLFLKQTLPRPPTDV